MKRTVLHGPLGRNLTYSLVEAIGTRIVTGGYDRRQFPTEAELEKQHGVSRSVTREAVKMLTAKGLLAARPRQGTRVMPPSSWNLFDPDVLRWILERKVTADLLRHFLELRLAIEPAAAELAAMRATPEGLELITRGFERMRQADAGEDDGLESDIEFHVAILQASDNPFFGQFRDVVGTALRTALKITMRVAHRRTADLAAHQKVFAAIRAGNPKKARAAMTDLLTATRVLVEGFARQKQG